MENIQYNIIITILNIIHRLIFYLKHMFFEATLCLLLQVVPTQLSPIDRATLCLRNVVCDVCPKLCNRAIKALFYTPEGRGFETR
jgi:hypothetical protein